MDDFEDRYNEAVKAGHSNLRAIKLLTKWCFHAEVVRSSGGGMIAAQTGLPIGHMGVQCKFSKKNSMHSWLLEDAAYDFYQSNCKDCVEHAPVGIPTIMDFVTPREQAAEERKSEREREEQLRKQAQKKRHLERAELRNELSLEETFALDLLDELDQESIAKDDPRLEQLANLAPETFTNRILEHLLPAVLEEFLPYSKPAAKALLGTSLDPEKKLKIAVHFLNNYGASSAAVDVIIESSEKLSREELIKVLRRFVSMALGPPPGMHFGGAELVTLESAPILSLFQLRRSEICTVVETFLSDGNPGKIQGAVEIILATESDELLSKHNRTIFAKLMRRRTLLPEERRDSSVIYYLRKAASKCLELFPSETDKIIQSFLRDNDKIGRKEANKAYKSALKYDFRENTQIGAAQNIAFKRLLWAAVERPENDENNAGEFFRHSKDQFAQLAVEYFDDLIGAAATLTEKYEQVNTKGLLDIPDDGFAGIERNNRLSAIDSLQGALIEWAAIGAKYKGSDGIEDFLKLFRGMPEGQTQMRGNMIIHVSKMLTGVESLTLILSDWYRAIMDESPLIRAHAAQAWENVPFKLTEHFPDLFFEAFSVLLTDPYVMVHKSAVRALNRRSFPKEKRNLISTNLWNLIFHYSQESKQNDFVVECIGVFTHLCVSSEQKRGKAGEILTSILLKLNGSALYHAVDKLHLDFRGVPGFAKVAIKSIQEEYTRSISIDDSTNAILSSSRDELQECVSEIKNAFENLKPFRPETFIEALLYAAALTKAGSYSVASDCFRDMERIIPKEKRNELWRLETVLVAVASEIEHAIETNVVFGELTKEWDNLVSELEKENEERAKLRNFSTSNFFKD